MVHSAPDGSRRNRRCLRSLVEFVETTCEEQRAVAQLGSALDWGSRGRRFKSCQPDFVMSQDIEDSRTCIVQVRLFDISGLWGW